MRSINADPVVDYTRADFADGPNRYDVILDIAGPWLAGIDRQLRRTSSQRALYRYCEFR